MIREYKKIQHSWQQSGDQKSKSGKLLSVEEGREREKSRWEKLGIQWRKCENGSLMLKEKTWQVKYSTHTMNQSEKKEKPKILRIGQQN